MNPRRRRRRRRRRKPTPTHTHPDPHPDPLTTKLLDATTSGQLDLVRDLVTSGAPLDAPDAQGLAPLHCAVRSGSQAMVSLLLQLGADVNAPLSPIRPISLASSDDMIKLLERYGARPPPPPADRVDALQHAVAEQLNHQLAHLSTIRDTRLRQVRVWMYQHGVHDVGTLATPEAQEARRRAEALLKRIGEEYHADCDKMRQVVRLFLRVASTQ